MKMKKIVYIYSVVGMCILHDAYAQQDSVVATTNSWGVNRYRNEVATNLLPIVGLGSADVFLRRHHSRKIKNFQSVREAYRIRVATGIGKENYPINFSSSTRIRDRLYTIRKQSTGWSLSLQIGYEKQKIVGKFQLFYGIDLVGMYHLNKEETIDVVGYSRSKETISRVGCSPFIGFKYFIHSRVAVSVETALSIAYFSVQEYRESQGGSQDPVEPFEYNYSGWIVDFLPINYLNIGFYF